MLTSYVDGIMMTGSSINVLQHVQDLLKTLLFFISELGPVPVFLGIETIGDGARGALELSLHEQWNQC